MKQANHTLSIQTDGQGLYEFTNDVLNWVLSQRGHINLAYDVLHRPTFKPQGTPDNQKVDVA